MILALRISNFSVIQEVEVAFGGGFTVLTGETGAGKSIVVDALSLLLGGRADPDVIRTGADEAVVEALLKSTTTLRERLLALGLPDLGDEVSLRRVVGRQGRGKAYVNGALVTVGVLGQLMRGLVDITGQHEHVGLFDPGMHRHLLDSFGGLEGPLTAYKADYGRVREISARAEALGGDERRAQERLEFLRYQWDELERFGPKAGEEVRLEEERKRLAGAEKLKALSLSAEALLVSQDGSATELLGRALQSIHEAARWDTGLLPVAQRLEGALAEVEDAATGLARAASRTEADPARLADLDERLDTLKRLCRKHATDAAGLVSRQAELAQERDLLAHRDEALRALLKVKAEAEAAAWGSAQGLSAARAEAAVRLARSVEGALGRLAMPNARFEVRVNKGDTLRPEGADDVEFLFTANPGEPPKSLAKIASGGEASRLLLALKRSLLGQDLCQTYVLDEVDAGVSGATAEVVGQMVREVARARQVLCITHLPQVAACAEAHLRVEKSQTSSRTASSVSLLRAEERTRELARMLSGVRVTPEALGAAQALLKSAHARGDTVRMGRARRSA